MEVHIFIQLYTPTYCALSVTCRSLILKIFKILNRTYCVVLTKLLSSVRCWWRIPQWCCISLGGRGLLWWRPWLLSPESVWGYGLHWSSWSFYRLLLLMWMSLRLPTYCISIICSECWSSCTLKRLNFKSDHNAQQIGNLEQIYMK